MNRRISAARALWPRCPQPLDAAAYVAALALGYAVKRHSSAAGADDLAYLLRPTSALVEYATGHAFVAERGAGYFCRELHVVIAPVCSGANFLVVAFAALVLGFSSRAPRLRSKLAWFFGSAALAYSGTLVINAARITLSLRLAEGNADGALASQAAHRLLGIVTYVGGLLLLYALAARLLDSRKLEPIHFTLPLGVYSTVTLLVPWLRGAAERPEYWAHAAVVAIVIALAAALLAFGRLLGGEGDGRAGDRRGRRLRDRCLGGSGRSDEAIQELEQRALDLRPARRRHGLAIGVPKPDHVVEAVCPPLHVDSQDLHANR